MEVWVYDYSYPPSFPWILSMSIKCRSLCENLLRVNICCKTNNIKLKELTNLQVMVLLQVWQFSFLRGSHVMRR